MAASLEFFWTRPSPVSLLSTHKQSSVCSPFFFFPFMFFTFSFAPLLFWFFYRALDLEGRESKGSEERERAKRLRLIRWRWQWRSRWSGSRCWFWGCLWWWPAVSGWLGERESCSQGTLRFPLVFVGFGLGLDRFGSFLLLFWIIAIFWVNEK